MPMFKQQTIQMFCPGRKTKKGGRQFREYLDLRLGIIFVTLTNFSFLHIESLQKERNLAEGKTKQDQNKKSPLTIKIYDHFVRKM
ncbi:CLUMA_CG007081, isoform A [Clunio marinus]|uniref:CLUMA_CG007081, isoform A n=1 Tax=Clunio marinus TaxID=568069 RepID=A0A1J1I1T2_9DIPT|nr:CLUMA_CG007081, isoform A [Clunio marinus]